MWPGWVSCRAREPLESRSGSDWPQIGWLGPLTAELSIVTGNLWLPWQEVGAEPPRGHCWELKPCAPTLPRWLLWRGGLPLCPVLQVPVDGPEAEAEAEEPHTGLHQVFHQEKG